MGDADEINNIDLTPAARYYRLHRAEKLAKNKEEYNNNPEVIRKRAERERERVTKVAQKEALKKQKEAEKERIVLERKAIAFATSHKKTKSID
jgi:hypothetical protein